MFDGILPEPATEVGVFSLAVSCVAGARYGEGEGSSMISSCINLCMALKWICPTFPMSDTTVTKKNGKSEPCLTKDLLRSYHRTICKWELTPAIEVVRAAGYDSL